MREITIRVPDFTLRNMVLFALLFGLVVIATAIPTWILHACE